MDYAAAVSDTWRHRDLSDAAHANVSLVRYATLAASSHNTQPWKFKLEPGRILIRPDFSRRCPAVDPDDHHLFASIGCAAENLLLAAEACGLRAHAAYDEATATVQVALESAIPSRSPLFEAIPRRQCSRTQYDGTALPVGQLRLLEAACRHEGVSAVFFTNDTQKDQIADYVMAGNRAQFGNPRWAEEMRHWIRFNASEAVRERDGLYGAVLGIPEVPGWLGRRLMRVATSAERQNRKDVAHIRSSAAIAILISATDDKAHWIEAGRCYERLALQAAALDLRTAFINQPVEVPSLRAQFASFLGIDQGRPDFIVRIGRGPEMPRSLRRPVEQVLL